MKGRRRRSWLMGFAVIAGSVLVVVIMVSLRSFPSVEAPPVVHPLVTVTTLVAEEGPLVVQGYGTVRPLREVALVAEVTGRVQWISDAFVSGGVFREGEAFLQINPADYENAVTVAEAAVVQSQFDVLLAKEEMVLAKREWELLSVRTGDIRQPDTTVLGSLVWKEPQYEAAAALLRSAEAQLEDARMRLARTRVTAPFNGRVRSREADLGQVLAPGQRVGVFYGTDVVEVAVSLSAQEVALLSTGGGARAILSLEHPGKRHEWEGVVHRIEGAIQEDTRSLNVVVRVSEPYRVTDGRPQLRVGTFVTANIEGVHLQKFFALPRGALREDSTVWVVEEGRLVLRSVQVIQEVEGIAYVISGLTESNQVVKNPLPFMTEGTQVRVAREDESP